MEQFTALKRKALEKYFSRMNDQQRKAVFKIKRTSPYTGRSRKRQDHCFGKPHRKHDILRQRIQHRADLRHAL